MMWVLTERLPSLLAAPLGSPFSWDDSIRPRLKVRLEDRLHNELQCTLYHSIPDSGIERVRISLRLRISCFRERSGT